MIMFNVLCRSAVGCLIQYENENNNYIYVSGIRASADLAVG